MADKHMPRELETVLATEQHRRAFFKTLLTGSAALVAIPLMATESYAKSMKMKHKRKGKHKSKTKNKS